MAHVSLYEGQLSTFLVAASTKIVHRRGVAAGMKQTLGMCAGRLTVTVFDGDT